MTTVTFPSRSAIADRLFADETALVQSLAEEARLSSEQNTEVARIARALVAGVRANRSAQGFNQLLHAAIFALVRRRRGVDVPC